MLVDDFDPLKGKRLEILRKDGSVNKELEPKIDDDTLLKAYRTMVLTRVADEKAVKLQRQGRLGAYPPTKGQEASQIGPAMAMGPNDWLVWAFRELGGADLQGRPALASLPLLDGQRGGEPLSRGVNATPSVVPVGSQVPHAVGIAYAAKMRKEDTAVVCFFGDGARRKGISTRG